MPFFHQQDREGLRRHYLDAWRKYRDGRPLEPLEHQIVTVIELHPEYHATLEDGANAVAQDFAPESGRSNPFLHMGLHLAIREQVATDRPPGIAEVHRALLRALGDAHAAEHRMIEVLGEALWNAQRRGQPPDERAYLEALRQLPLRPR
jgi:hypothetical protein